MSEDLIDLQATSRLRAFSFRITPKTKGIKTGIHKSVHKGISPDFLEYKEYSQGDDLKHIDWRIYGRLDRLYVKKYEEEVSLNWCILIDRSASMEYGSNGVSKLDFAKRLSATLAYLILKQGDAVGIGDFWDKNIQLLPPRSGNRALTEILSKLGSLMPYGKTIFEEPISRAIEKIKVDTVIVIVSDFLIDLNSIKNSLKLLRSSKKEVILFHVLDRDEIEFNFSGSIEFKGMEGEKKILVDARNIRKSYKKHLTEFLRELEVVCYENQSKYVFSPTSSPIEDVLIQIANR